MASVTATAASITARTQAYFDEQRVEEKQRLKKVLIGAAIVALYPFVDSLLGLNLLGS